MRTMTFEELLANRSASMYADFFMPYLDADIHVLDLGCGDGAISVGLAAVAGRVTAIDVSSEAFAEASEHANAHGLENVTFAVGDAVRLGYGEATFDACFCHSMLEAVPVPADVLSEAWRVLKPGGRIGVASTEYGGLILAGPEVELLRRSNSIREALWLRWGSDPFLGRELRRLLGEVGFDEIEAATKVFSYGTAALVREFGAGRAEECRDAEYVAEAVEAGLATADELASMAEAWSSWGESPASYAAFSWCRALGRKPPGGGDR